MHSDNLLYREESYAIRGAIFEVYRNLGAGFLESVYQESLALEFRHKGIPKIEQPEVSIHYKNDILKQKYYPDFVCFDSIIIEIKAVKEICPEHEAQLLNYLKATGMKLGFLVNFGAYPKAIIKRFVL
jgi:GxxExxY protein